MLIKIPIEIKVEGLNEYQRNSPYDAFHGVRIHFIIVKPCV